MIRPDQNVTILTNKMWTILVLSESIRTKNIHKIEGLLQNRWSHLFCISPFSVILIVIFYFVGQIENKSYFLPNPAMQDMRKFYKKQVFIIWFGHIENLWYQMPRKLGKFGQKMHKNLYMANLFNFWNYIAKNIFFTANIGRDEIQTFHIPKWISCEGSAAFTQNIPQGSEVYRPDSGCMKPCRNGVINKKEAVRMLLDDYSSILQQPLYWLWKIFQ